MKRRMLLHLDFVDKTSMNVYAVARRTEYAGKWQGGVQINDDTPKWKELYAGTPKQAIDGIVAKLHVDIEGGSLVIEYEGE